MEQKKQVCSVANCVPFILAKRMTLLMSGQTLDMNQNETGIKSCDGNRQTVSEYFEKMPICSNDTTMTTFEPT